MMSHLIGYAKTSDNRASKNLRYKSVFCRSLWGARLWRSTILKKMPSEKAASFIHISYSYICFFQTALKEEYSSQKQSLLLRWTSCIFQKRYKKWLKMTENSHRLFKNCGYSYIIYIVLLCMSERSGVWKVISPYGKLPINVVYRSVVWISIAHRDASRWKGVCRVPE